MPWSTGVYGTFTVILDSLGFMGICGLIGINSINSMRSQLLISLEQFKGVVIFATNLVENYDKAFETRIRHIRFAMPDRRTRAEIWRRHLPAQLPLARDVSIEDLAEAEEVCGRDIKNAVIDAAVRAARAHHEVVTHEDLRSAIERIKAGRMPSQPSRGHSSAQAKQPSPDQVQEALNRSTGATVVFVKGAIRKHAPL